MAQRESVPPRWLRASIAISVVVLLAIDVGTVLVRHNDAKPVTVHDAIQQYRSDTNHTPTATPTHSATPEHSPRPVPTPTTAGPTATATATASPTSTVTVPAGHSHQPSARPTAPTPTPTESAGAIALPPPGVYSYATSGEERVGGVPGGSRTFPKTTAITVESAGCGISERWEPNTDHSETRELCLDHQKVRLASFATKVSFFGVGGPRDYACGADAVVYSPKNKLGTSQTFRCSSKDSTADLTVTPVGYRRFHVDGTSVRTLQVTVSTDLSGASTGQSTQQLWFTTDDSLLVRTTSQVDATQGGFTYHEHYTLMLDRLTPKR